jgi:hypothetical protein
MPKSAPFVPRTLPPPPPERPTSRAHSEREAKAYWDSLTEAQEVWALCKMGYFKIGPVGKAAGRARQRPQRVSGPRVRSIRDAASDSDTDTKALI